MSQSNNIVLCVPTREERDGILKFLPNDSAVQFEITGMGVMQTAFHICEMYTRLHPTYIVHMGVAGSYKKSLGVGDVAEIKSEAMADFGAEDAHKSHITFQQIVPSIDPNHGPWSKGLLLNASTNTYNLQEVTGLTVPFASGSIETIARRQSYDCDIENMEGAGLFYACLSLDIPFTSIRAISNIVEPRNKSAWNFEQAFQGLAHFIQSNFL